MSSCYLEKKNDWLEYDFNSSFILKGVYVALIIIGAVIIYFASVMYSKILSCSAKPTVLLQTCLNVLFISSALLIFVPLALLILDFNVSYKENTFPYITVGIIILGLIAILIGAMIVVIQTEVGKLDGCKDIFNSFMWAPAGVLIVVVIGLIIYKWQSSSGIDIEKRTIDWTNPYEFEPLIDIITEKQYKKCNMEIGTDVDLAAGIVAFTHYLEQRKKLPPSKRKPLPKDLIPNIPKMVNQMQRDAEEGFSRKLSARIPLLLQNKNVDEKTVLKSLVDEKRSLEQIRNNPLGQSPLSKIVGYPLKKFAEFTGLNQLKSYNPLTYL
jgi:hypothetical protein